MGEGSGADHAHVDIGGRARHIQDGLAERRPVSTSVGRLKRGDGFGEGNGGGADVGGGREVRDKGNGFRGGSVRENTNLEFLRGRNAPSPLSRI